MLGWAIGFFLAAIVAAVFGFGGIASAFAGIAVILFWLFVGLFVVSLVLSFVRPGHAVVAGEPHVAHGPSTGGVGLLALVAVGAILAYAWIKNDWSATEVGQAIDRTATQVTADAGDVIEGAGNRAENLVDEASDDMRGDDENRDNNN